MSHEHVLAGRRPPSRHRVRWHRLVTAVALIAGLLVPVTVASAAGASEHESVTFSGTVSASDGSSVADVVVSVFERCWWAACEEAQPPPDQQAERALPVGPVSFLGESGADRSGAWSVTVATGADGNSPLLVFWDRSAKLASEYVSLWRWEDTQEDVELVAGGRISGTFTDSTRTDLPAGDFAIMSGTRWFRYADKFTLQVDAATGRFVSPAVVPGTYSLGYGNLGANYLGVNRAAVVEVAAGSTAAAPAVELLMSGAIGGTVTDESGSPLEGIVVSGRVNQIVTSGYGGFWEHDDSIVSDVDMFDGEATPFGLNAAEGFQAVTDADGAYEVDGLVPGDDWQIRFTDPSGKFATEHLGGFAGISESVLALVAAGSSTTGLNASLEMAASVRVTFVDSLGATVDPSDAGHVELCSAASAAPHYCPSWLNDQPPWINNKHRDQDETGVRFGRLMGGSYIIKTDDFSVAERLQLGVGEHKDISLVLPGGRIRATVTDQNGQPLELSPGVRNRIIRFENDKNDNGVFESQLLPPGQYPVSVWPFEPVDVNVATEGVSTIEFVIPIDASIRGRVTVGSRPISDVSISVRVSFSDYGRCIPWSDISDERGFFELHIISSDADVASAPCQLANSLATVDGSRETFNYTIEEADGYEIVDGGSVDLESACTSNAADGDCERWQILPVRSPLPDIVLGPDEEVFPGLYTPGGRVLNQRQEPVAGASVTLLRQVPTSGDFEALTGLTASLHPAFETSGSVVTSGDGVFRWLASGWYRYNPVWKLRAEGAGCYDPDDLAVPWVQTEALTGYELGQTLVLRCFQVPVGGVHSAALAALRELGVFEGLECRDGDVCPYAAISRRDMAVWLVRVLDEADPDASGTTRFADVAADAWWAPFADRLAELGVTAGCRAEPLSYCPDDMVTRAQMALFLVRAFDLPSAGSFGFVDTSGTAAEAAIDSLAAAGVTSGCKAAPRSYCPSAPVTRAQMATFLARALDLGG